MRATEAKLKAQHNPPEGRSKPLRRSAGLISIPLVLMTSLSACGGGTPAASPRTPGSSTTTPAAQAAPAITTGRHVEALDFAVKTASTVVPKSLAATGASVVAKSPTEAVKIFLGALIDGDGDLAWSMLSQTEQGRLGYQQRLLADVAANGWTSFKIASATDTSVTAEVQQTAKVSDIDGVIAASASVTFPTVSGASGYSVVWSRRSVNQHLPERTPASDREVEQAVVTWSLDRQRCLTSDAEYVGGLIGVIGLANQLCKTSGTPVVTGTSDLDALDEPQPIIDGFGGSALVWARVVTMKSPVAMNVVVAPNGDTWTVIAIARPSIATS